jgi:GNAT superfamily N-acetyltransferase
LQYPPAPVIQNSSIDDIELLTDILSDSFSNDPIMNWVMPLPSIYPDFFRLLLTDLYLPRGIAHHDSEGRAAALWLPPGETFSVPPRWVFVSMLARLVGRKGLRPLWRMHQQGSLFDHHHPTEPHFYLQFLGARHANQGQGAGSALLKHGTRMCDEHRMPAYLESSNILNVPLYQRHGFEIIHEETLPAGGPTGWFMWREARQRN